MTIPVSVESMGLSFVILLFFFTLSTTLFLHAIYNNFSMESNSTEPLRHEATSRLFEKELNPVEVATITGHKDTKMLMRYTHLRAEDLAKHIAYPA